MLAKILLAAAVVLVLVAGVVWAVFLRPVPVHTAVGTIARKTFKPAGTYWQYPSDAYRSGFRMATPIPIAEAYVFEIAAEGFNGPIFFSENTVASRDFDVGRRVSLRYRERGLPLFPKRLYVLDMSPAAP